MTAATLTGVFAVKLTVRDLVARRRWYEQVFDLRVLFEFPDEVAVDAWGAKLDALGVAHEVELGTIGWVPVFHDPDGLEIHLYSREHHGEDLSGRSGHGRASPVPDTAS